MVVLICLSALLALILFLLLCPIRITIRSQGEDLSVVISYLFFHRTRYPEEEQIRLKNYTPRRIRRRLKKARLRKQITQQKVALQKASKEKSLISAMELRILRLLLHLLRDIYKPVLSALRIRVDRLRVEIGSEDAAQTAILYGAAAQSVAYILALLDDHTRTRINDAEVAVLANFAEDKTVTDVKIRLLISPLRVIGLYAKAIVLLIKEEASIEKEKNIVNGENKDERKQSQ